MSGRIKIWYIVNPISGTRDKGPIIDMIPQYMDPERFQYEIRYTEHRGHAAELAAEAISQNIDVCVAVGGDGTVNETARALIHTNTALGIIPCGSGNGLARHLHLPMNPWGALEVIARCDIHALDYGLINGQPFFCTAGVGFDATLSDRFNKAGKRGLITYVENALKTGLSYQPETYELTIDDNTEQKYRAFLITAANASQYGNDFFIAPHASMSDGLLDITIMEPFNLLESAQIAYQMVHKTITNNPHIHALKCRHLHIHRTQPGVIHYDGDPKDEVADVDIRIVPKDIRMIVNLERQPRRSHSISTDLLRKLRAR